MDLLYVFGVVKLCRVVDNPEKGGGSFNCMSLFLMKLKVRSCSICV